MCGRIAQSRYQDYLHLFEIDDAGRLVPVPPPRFNIAPSLEVIVCRARPQGGRELRPLIWGLLPRWVKEPARIAHPINARVEGVADKPMFRGAFAAGRRCLIPVEGFYEWRREGKGKQPYFVRLASGAPMVLAGLWDHWEGIGHAPVDSFTILVAPANAAIAPLHDRMPLLVAPDHFTAWLDPRTDGRALLATLLKDEAALEIYPVSTAVNNARNDGAELMQPLQRDPPAR